MQQTLVGEGNSKEQVCRKTSSNFETSFTRIIERAAVTSHMALGQSRVSHLALDQSRV